MEKGVGGIVYLVYLFLFSPTTPSSPLLCNHASLPSWLHQDPPWLVKSVSFKLEFCIKKKIKITVSSTF